MSEPIISVTELPLASWLLCHGIPFVGEDVQGSYVTFKFQHVPEYQTVHNNYLSGQGVVKIGDYLQAWGNLQRIIKQYRRGEER